MRRALRNLIAFVFLGGIFWFAYQDLDNLSNPRFQTIIGALICIFALFWLLVPIAVVKMRIIRRNAKNQRGFEEWKKRSEGVKTGKVKGVRLILEAGEKEFFHEKGTLYVEPGKGFDEFSHPGQVGDVAFPKENRDWRRIQRVHFYLTDRRIFFIGKELDYKLDLASLANYRKTPGGLVFETDDGVFCFTFSNPLITASILDEVR